MHYYSLNEYLKKTFNEKVYKLAISLAETCPNRDGSLSRKGCIFCSADGSGEFAQKSTSIIQQIENAKKLINEKTNAKKYIAYFQSFTNTYLPYEKMYEAFTQALFHKDICAVSIATRPDCISEKTLDLLERLNLIKPIWVELGLQTSNERTAEYINRCYPNSVYEKTVNNLKKRKIVVITHMIIGLPGESKEDMLNTAKYIAALGSDGIKFHLLHVLKGSGLEEEYYRDKFKVLTKQEYIDILTDIIEYLPEDMVIHRLTGDGDKKTLIAPLWSADKKDVLNSINKAIRLKDIQQGRKYK